MRYISKGLGLTERLDHYRICPDKDTATMLEMFDELLEELGYEVAVIEYCPKQDIYFKIEKL